MKDNTTAIAVGLSITGAAIAGIIAYFYYKEPDGIVCTEGATRCFNDANQICTNNAWVADPDGTVCPSGCVENATRCGSLNHTETCVGGHWVDSGACGPPCTCPIQSTTFPVVYKGTTRPVPGVLASLVRQSDGVLVARMTTGTDGLVKFANVPRDIYRLGLTKNSYHFQDYNPTTGHGDYFVADLSNISPMYSNSDWTLPWFLFMIPNVPDLDHTRVGIGAGPQWSASDEAHTIVQLQGTCGCGCGDEGFCQYTAKHELVEVRAEALNFWGESTGADVGTYIHIEAALPSTVCFLDKRNWDGNWEYKKLASGLDNRNEAWPLGGHILNGLVAMNRNTTATNTINVTVGWTDPETGEARSWLYQLSFLYGEKGTGYWIDPCHHVDMCTGCAGWHYTGLDCSLCGG